MVELCNLKKSFLDWKSMVNCTIVFCTYLVYFPMAIVTYVPIVFYACLLLTPTLPTLSIITGMAA